MLAVVGAAWLWRVRFTPRPNPPDMRPRKAGQFVTEAPARSGESGATSAEPVVARGREATPEGPRAEATDPRDLANRMTPVEEFARAGRATPGAAFQTVIWAAMKGDDDELAATLVLADGAREKAEAWRAALPAEVQQKYAVLEKLPGLFLTEEIVRKAASAQIVETIEEAPGRVTLRVRTATVEGGSAGISSFPLKQGEGGWQLEIPADMVEAMRKKAAGPGARPARRAGK
ncbi:MAG: hypothetical protein NTV51_22850 [Verrucomicrobia bacterium]|nr:hypothetical protein [Verrucomicrobiota bacterium]